MNAGMPFEREELLSFLARQPNGRVACSLKEISAFDDMVAQALELGWVSKDYNSELGKFWLTITPAGRRALEDSE